MPVPFVGPSYQLASRTADVQRSVNLRPVPVESGTGKSAFMLQSNPGLVQVVSIGGEGRAAFAVNDRKFVIVGQGLYEINADMTSTLRGQLATTTGRVSIDANSVELFMVDGFCGYTFNFTSGTFLAVSNLGMNGSKRTAYLDQYAIYAPDGGSTFYISGLGDAGTVDALDFASAEAMPDHLVSLLVSNRQLYLLGGSCVEIWINTGDVDFPLQRYDGAVMGIGCVATHSAQVCNGTPVWLGTSRDGVGSVWAANGYTPQRISTRAVEEAIGQSADLSSSYAYCWSWHGSSMYCLRVPGLETTWTYDFLSQSWHEQAELTSGVFGQHRICATMVADGQVYALSDAGVVYRYDAQTYTFGGDTLCRDRISPHEVASGERQFFSSFELGVDTGVTGQAMLRASNDGGSTWGDWRRRSLGELGKQKQRMIWNRCGSARDRVWHVRCTDAVPFSIIDGGGK